MATEVKRYTVTVEVAEDGTQTLRSWGAYEDIVDGEVVERNVARSVSAVDESKTSATLVAEEKLALEGKIGGTVTLDELKAKKMVELYISMDGFFYKYWKTPHRITILFFGLIGVKESQVNRNAKFMQIHDWILPIYEYYYGKSDAINAATTEAELNAVTWDFEQYGATKPAVDARDIVLTQD